MCIHGSVGPLSTCSYLTVLPTDQTTLHSRLEQKGLDCSEAPVHPARRRQHGRHRAVRTNVPTVHMSAAPFENTPANHLFPGPPQGYRFLIVPSAVLVMHNYSFNNLYCMACVVCCLCRRLRMTLNDVLSHTHTRTPTKHTHTHMRRDVN